MLPFQTLVYPVDYRNHIATHTDLKRKTTTAHTGTNRERSVTATSPDRKGGAPPFIAGTASLQPQTA